MVPERQCPHPRRASRSCMDLEDAADNFTARKHVETVLVPVAGRATCRCAFEDEVVLLHPATILPSGLLSRTDYQGIANYETTRPPLRVRKDACTRAEAGR